MAEQETIVRYKDLEVFATEIIKRDSTLESEIKNAKEQTGALEQTIRNNSTDIENLQNKISGLDIENRLTQLETVIQGLPTTYLDINKVYPIGSIYMSLENTSPATFIGGTWQRIGVGRTLISAGNGDAPEVDENTNAERGTYSIDQDAFPVGETGGEFNHTLTVNQIPAHNHKANQWLANTGNNFPAGKLGASMTQSTSTRNNIVTSINELGTERYSENAGGGKGFNIMQPYLSVYMWKRTA